MLGNSVICYFYCFFYPGFRLLFPTVSYILGRVLDIAHVVWFIGFYCFPSRKKTDDNVLIGLSYLQISLIFSRIFFFFLKLCWDKSGIACTLVLGFTLLLSVTLWIYEYFQFSTRYLYSGWSDFKHLLAQPQWISLCAYIA